MNKLLLITSLLIVGLSFGCGKSDSTDAPDANEQTWSSDENLNIVVTLTGGNPKTSYYLAKSSSTYYDSKNQVLFEDPETNFEKSVWKIERTDIKQNYITIANYANYLAGKFFGNNLFYIKTEGGKNYFVTRDLSNGQELNRMLLESYSASTFTTSLPLTSQLSYTVGGKYYTADHAKRTYILTKL